MITYLLPIWLVLESIALVLPSEWSIRGATFLREAAPKLNGWTRILDRVFDTMFVGVAKVISFSPGKSILGSSTVTQAHLAWIVSVPIAILIYLVWARARKSPKILDDLLVIFPVSYLGWGMIARILLVTGVPGGEYLLTSWAFPAFFGILSLSLLHSRVKWENARVVLVVILVWSFFLSGEITTVLASVLEFLGALRENPVVTILIGIAGLVMGLGDLFGLRLAKLQRQA